MSSWGFSSRTVCQVKQPADIKTFLQKYGTFLMTFQSYKGCEASSVVLPGSQLGLVPALGCVHRVQGGSWAALGAWKLGIQSLFLTDVLKMWGFSFFFFCFVSPKWSFFRSWKALEGTYILSRSGSKITPTVGISLRSRKSWLRKENYTALFLKSLHPLAWELLSQSVCMADRWSNAC